MNEFFDNLEELATGFGLGICYVGTMPLSTTLSLAVAVLLAILWRLGGYGYKWARRYAIPILMALLAVWALKSPLFGVFLLWVPIFSIGYGIPDTTDSGSVLGRFVYNLVGKKESLATFVTRLILALLMWVVILPCVKVDTAYVVVSGFLFLLYYPIVSVISGSFRR